MVNPINKLKITENKMYNSLHTHNHTKINTITKAQEETHTRGTRIP